MRFEASLLGMVLTAQAAGAAAPPTETATAHFCAQCGTAIAPGTRFCPHCGAAVAES